MKKMVLKLAATAALAAAAVAAQAQPAAAPVPNNVGVTQGTANEAATKAVPRSDTATLVRTAPNAADRTRAAADTTQNTATTTTGAGAGAGAGMTSAAQNMPAAAPVQRARKADRN